MSAAICLCCEWLCWQAIGDQGLAVGSRYQDCLLSWDLLHNTPSTLKAILDLSKSARAGISAVRGCADKD